MYSRRVLGGIAGEDMDVFQRPEFHIFKEEIKI